MYAHEIVQFNVIPAQAGIHFHCTSRSLLRYAALPTSQHIKRSMENNTTFNPSSRFEERNPRWINLTNGVF